MMQRTSSQALLE
jgi:hypothetical protein